MVSRLSMSQYIVLAERDFKVRAGFHPAELRSSLGPLGILSVLHEPSSFGLCEALRILFGLKGEDGLVSSMVTTTA